MNIHVNHINLHYQSSGNGEPLILIGGLTANCREWNRVIPHLQSSFTVYTPENRGAGSTSGWSNDFTIEDMANDIAAFIEALHLERALIVGHSMGGSIAQQLCIMHPHRVKAAVIASSFAKFPKAGQLYIENTAELLGAGVNLELVLKTIYTRLYGSLFLSDSAKVASEFDRMLNDPVLQTPEGYNAQVQAIAKVDTRKHLAHIACPVLVVNGNEDVLTPSLLSEELHTHITNSKLKLIADCGHMLPQENPEAFAECVLDFFHTITNDSGR